MLESALERSTAEKQKSSRKLESLRRNLDEYQELMAAKNEMSSSKSPGHGGRYSFVEKDVPSLEQAFRDSAQQPSKGKRISIIKVILTWKKKK